MGDLNVSLNIDNTSMISNHTDVGISGLSEHDLYEIRYYQHNNDLTSIKAEVEKIDSSTGKVILRAKDGQSYTFTIDRRLLLAKELEQKGEEAYEAGDLELAVENWSKALKIAFEMADDEAKITLAKYIYRACYKYRVEVKRELSLSKETQEYLDKIHRPDNPDFAKNLYLAEGFRKYRSGDFAGAKESWEAGLKNTDEKKDGELCEYFRKCISRANYKLQNS